MKRTLFLLIFLITGTSPAAAQTEARAFAELSARSVPLGSAASLSVTVEGVQQAQPPGIPVVEGLEFQYQGPSQSIQVVNGAYSASVTFRYSILPIAEGRYTIPALTVQTNGRTLTTDPVELVVSDAGTSAAGDSRPGAQLSDRIFLQLQLAKDSVYVNEPVPAKLYLYVQNLAVRDLQLPELDGVGYVIDEYDQPRQFQDIINGVRFDIIEFDRVLYPTRTGELMVGPASLQASLLFDSGRVNRSTENIFDDDFFSSLFRRQEKKPIVLNSNAAILNVSPVPKEGKPSGYSGGVGSFSFEASLGPSEVKVGDPLTLRMTVTGEGYLGSVGFPSVEKTPGFKFYDPSIKEEDGTKVYEQVVIPTKATLNEFPAIAFSYFDPELQSYRTVRKGPFPLTVEAAAEDDDIKIVGMDRPPRDFPGEVIGEDIIYIKSQIGKVRWKGERIYTSFWFYFVIVVLAGVWSGVFAWLVHHQRLRSDVVYARQLKAPLRARKSMKEARDFMERGESAAFFDTVSRSLTDYISNKLTIPQGAVTSAAVKEKLARHRGRENLTADIKAFLEKCEEVRYASRSSSREEMAETMGTLERIIDQLERVKI